MYCLSVISYAGGVVVIAITLRKQVEVCGGRLAYKCLSALLLSQSESTGKYICELIMLAGGNSEGLSQ